MSRQTKTPKININNIGTGSLNGSSHFKINGSEPKTRSALTNGKSSVAMEIFFDVDNDILSTIHCSGLETVEWLLQNALKRYYIVSESCNGKLGQMVTLKLGGSKQDLDLDSTIMDVLTNGDTVKIDFKIKPAPFETSTNQNNTMERIRRKKVVQLDGNSLTCEELMEMGYGEVAVKLTAEAVQKVMKARRFLEEGILKSKRITYGVNTGFGKFASTLIEEDELELLQENLILATAAGVGDILNQERTRRMLALRINVLAKGLSGISLGVLNQYIEAFNSSSLSCIPEQGTVGASGDLAPLSHLTLGLMGRGNMWCSSGGYEEAAVLLKKNGLKRITLRAKEGLALINGTQMMTALGVEALVRSEKIARQADIVACLTIEALKGIKHAFDIDLHKARPHRGQNVVASRLRCLLDSEKYPSQIWESQKDPLRVQDAYTLRCIPQVHGIVNDTLAFVRGVLETEMNSATDNPIILADRQDVISGGNFHGEYPAKCLDYLAIAIHEISNMSERRTDRLMNPAYSGMPAFLTSKGGLNCGLMIAQYTAASLVSENKVLCHPSSVDSITTCAGTEDHVSMGGWAVRKALKVVQNVESVVGIELLSACQGIEFHRPLHTTSPLESVHALVRSVVKAWDKDRYLAPDIAASTDLLRNNQVWLAVRPFLEAKDQEKFTEIWSKF